MQVNQANKAQVCRELLGACLPVFTLLHLCSAAQAETNSSRRVSTRGQQSLCIVQQQGQFRGGKMGSRVIREAPPK